MDIDNPHTHRLPSEATLIEAQQEVDNAYANLQEYKTREIKNMMDMSFKQVPVDTETEKRKTARIHDEWKTWFIFTRFEHQMADKQTKTNRFGSFSMAVNKDNKAPCLNNQFVEWILATMTAIHLDENDDDSKKFAIAMNRSWEELNSPNHAETPTLQWKEDEHNKHSASMRASSGLFFEIQPLSARSLSGPTPVADHRYAQYADCRLVTRGFTFVPLTLKISLEGCDRVINANLYPRINDEEQKNGLGGMLVGAKYINDVKKSTGTPTTILETHGMSLAKRGSSGGISEKDAASLLVKYAREYRKRLVDMFVVCHIMRAVAGLEGHEYEIPELHDLAESDIQNLHKRIRDTLTDEMIDKAKAIFGKMHSHYGQGQEKTIGENGDIYNIVCTGGTVDCFDNDTHHTDMALHTNNIAHIECMIDGEPLSICADFSISIYSTYYIGGHTTSQPPADVPA